ncbi:heparan-alpha-glucosaminide N-acetyltransferase domain-containing protein [Isosphaeraceae bacterium EP7]
MIGGEMRSRRERDEAGGAGRGRIESLDQFRGYTVAGMLLVNFAGGYQAVPAVLKHHNTYCSYADTIMPQFFFAVGFAFRMTLLRRLTRDGGEGAWRHAIVRNLWLILSGLVFYNLDGNYKSWEQLRELGVFGVVAGAFQREPFQTLVHIGIASLWCLPAMAAGPLPRLGFLAFTTLLHLGLSAWFYDHYAWNRPVIDGGPLGFLSWSIPLLIGSLSYDLMKIEGRRWPVARLAVWSLPPMAIGYGLSCLGTDGVAASPPFWPPTTARTIWTMSQRTGSVSYMLFSSGFSLLIYSGFVLACDVGRLRFWLFDVLGKHALAAYLIHGTVGRAIQPFVPKDSPAWYLVCGLVVLYALTAAFVRQIGKGSI